MLARDALGFVRLTLGMTTVWADEPLYGLASANVALKVVLAVTLVAIREA